MFRALVRAGKAVPAGRLAESLEVSPTTLSFHLKELKNSGVVSCERSGRSLLYSADFSTMRELLDFITHDCCRGL